MRKVFAILMIAVPAFCAFRAPVHGEPVRVGVSVLPLESVVEEIGGAQVEAQSLQREGDSCSVFEPRPSVISWLAGAELFFRTGAGYEAVIMDKVRDRFSGLKVVDLRESVNVLPLKAHAHHHGHAHEGHSCGESCPVHGAPTDPHIWLDPLRLMQIADRIAAELAATRPGQAGAFRASAAAVEARARALHQRLSELLAPHAGRAFFIYHPALQYFADRYNLEQVAIADGHDPSPRILHERITEARAAGVKTIFVQPQENRKHAEIIASAIGAEVVEINPMAPDWEANLLEIGQALATAFGKETE